MSDALSAERLAEIQLRDALIAVGYDGAKISDEQLESMGLTRADVSREIVARKKHSAMLRREQRLLRVATDKGTRTFRLTGNRFVSVRTPRSPRRCSTRVPRPAVRRSRPRARAPGRTSSDPHEPELEHGARL